MRELRTKDSCEFRELTEQEYDEELRKRAQVEENGHSEVSQEAWQLAGQAWKMRKQGYSLWHIAKQLSVPIDFLVRVLESFEAQLVLEARRAVDYYRAADLERLQKLVTHYLPLALSEVDLQNIDAAELDHSLKAANLVLKAIGEKARLLGLGEPGREKDFAGKNVSGWLENNLPAITKLLTGAGPKEQVEGR